MKTPWWFLHKTPLAILLLPVSFIYWFISKLVYGVRKLHVYKSRRPIICVGNILAGGVGKTPIVRNIATYLDAPVVMRGYKKSAGTGNAGDEALMMARDGIQVHTGSRKSNIVLLNKQSADSGPIVMDDGFQNPSIHKDISLVVFDETLGVGNGFILPAGPLRESRRALKRADAIIVIKSKDKVKRKLKLPADKPVFYAERQTVSPYDQGTALVAFAGIGYPKKFFRALSGCKVVATRSFADHWEYTDEDIEKLVQLAKKKKAKLVTTEKDWVRLNPKIQDKIKYAKLVTVIDNQFFDWLNGRLKNGNA